MLNKKEKKHCNKEHATYAKEKILNGEKKKTNQQKALS